jgi:Flp pilus assembly protein TadD
MLPTSEPNRRQARRLISAGVLAVALISTGWSAQALARRATASAAIDSASPAQAITQGEAAVRKDPRDAGLRAALGRAYLRSGRFESAAAVLSDAMTLGDGSPRTVLSLALARTAMGEQVQALTLLQGVQGSLPAADYGLALALAGQPAQGISVLSEAARAGQSTEKLRQNLAYAYALDGRWGEARTLVAMDLPADKVDSRLTQWAASARPEAVRTRVAALLGAPVVADAGLPGVLALNGAPSEHLAVKAPVAAPLPAPAAAPAPERELPALTGDTAPAPAAQPAAEPARAMGGMLASADTPPAPPAFTPVTPQGVNQAPTTYEPVSKPVATPLRVAYAAADKPRAEKPRLRAEKPVVKASVKLAKARSEDDAPRAANGTHLIQIGAFSSSANAERARKLALAHRPELRAHDIVITKAVVNGRDFWRVAASGFDSASASGACGRVKKAGGACFAYENGHLPTGQALAMAAPAPTPGRKR